MSWIEALKQWNSAKKVHNGAWCVPKKGTTEYYEVMNIMKGEKKTDVEQQAKKKIGLGLKPGKVLTKEEILERKKVLFEKKKKEREEMRNIMNEVITKSNSVNRTKEPLL